MNIRMQNIHRFNFRERALPIVSASTKFVMAFRYL